MTVCSFLAFTVRFNAAAETEAKREFDDAVREKARRREPVVDVLPDGLEPALTA